jgi:hypothetical protein
MEDGVGGASRTHERDETCIWYFIQKAYRGPEVDGWYWKES